jgi:hypothetical protein
MYFAEQNHIGRQLFDGSFITNFFPQIILPSDIANNFEIQTTKTSRLNKIYFSAILCV